MNQVRAIYAAISKKMAAAITYTGEFLHAYLFIYMVRTGCILFEGDPEPIMKELKRIGDQVKEVGEKALKEAEKAGQVSEDTKKAADQLLVKQGELQARLQEVEQKLDKHTSGPASVEFKSIGGQVVESDELKEYVKEGNFKKSITVQVKAVTSAANSVGAAVAPDRLAGIVTLPQQRLTVRDLLSPGRTSSNLVQYIKETGFVNNAGMVAEGTKKPESSITMTEAQSVVAKIAHFIKASSEIMSDFPALQSIIDTRLRYGLALIEEAQLLKGSGVGNNLNGIYTQASQYAAPIAINSPTRIDVLRLALLQAELAEYPSTGIVLNPADWTAIELQKDSTGAYIFANPQSTAQPGLWGRPVVTTKSMTVDEFLVGAFKMGAQIFDREQASVTIATQNEDDFVKNLVTILAEERLALADYRPEAFVKGDLTPAAA